MTVTPSNPQHLARQRWLQVLARANADELQVLYAAQGPLPAPHWVRPCEIGMIMLRARIGGTGEPFNLGEATVTRCALRLGDSALGVGYTLGRQQRKAELIACFDALLQDPSGQAELTTSVIDPLAQRQAQLRDSASRSVASSRVEFYTMVRGET